MRHVIRRFSGKDFTEIFFTVSNQFLHINQHINSATMSLSKRRGSKDMLGCKDRLDIYIISKNLRNIEEAFSS